MKKAITGLVFASLTLLVFPLAFSLTELFGYTFKLNYRSIFVITGALLPFTAAVLGAVSKTDTVGKAFKVITSMLPPLSVLNAFYYVWNIKAFVFTVSKKPERVYTGDWGENPYVYREDKDSLIVNSKEYIIG